MKVKTGLAAFMPSSQKMDQAYSTASRAAWGLCVEWVTYPAHSSPVLWVYYVSLIPGIWLCIHTSMKKWLT